MKSVAAPTLTRAQLNRATLARQMLLAREKTTALRAIERLAGLQAQVAKPPFIGLWTRVEGFDREHLRHLLHARKVVRATLMRGTLHLVSAKDYVQLRAAIQPALTAALRERPNDLLIADLTEAARAYFAEEPRTFDDLRPWLLARFPKGDERAMGYAVRTHLPLVQVPTEADWGFPSAASFTSAEDWLGARLAAANTSQLVLRYLAAFGPATAADMQTWSALRGLAEVVEGLRDRLVSFRDERGRELFDLAKSPRPPANTPAPVRFLPEFDNLVLSHADRTRIVADAHRPALVTKNLQVKATFLVDGFVAGTWRTERAKTAATLLVEPFEKLPARARDELAREGERLLRFAEAAAERFLVSFRPPRG